MRRVVRSRCVCRSQLSCSAGERHHGRVRYSFAVREACPSRQRAHVCEMQHSQHSPRALSWDVQLCPCAASARFVVENDHWDRKLSCSNARAITDRAEGGRRARGAACDSNAARHAEMHASHRVTLIHIQLGKCARRALLVMSLTRIRFGSSLGAPIFYHFCSLLCSLIPYGYLYIAHIITILQAILLPWSLVKLPKPTKQNKNRNRILRTPAIMAAGSFQVILNAAFAI